mmetsp:Transcript_4057/g.6070  ORF Transcript_4057/g.6070 Transcript_4057/m.6070 type:complete len:138 (-) Transcript_4057:2017-2430(-)|eukprot:CAMPEP_0170480760 /NCGR_PEP_ID=MMETSP0208-20121228/1473_1 /TAXON_ID=197538 /ORGANISM="Strombidium inclinatum, Strain S3" /LENGTH=137 /DNA_ID=CAMNT_0010753355 /DNA_START=384 /DNA_END=797 /DNA_ORIENTATION=-
MDRKNILASGFKLNLEYWAMCRCRPSERQEWCPKHKESFVIIDLEKVSLDGEKTKGKLFNLHLRQMLGEELRCENERCLWKKKIKRIQLKTPLPKFFWVALRGADNSQDAIADLAESVPWVLRIGDAFTAPLKDIAD